MTNKKKTKDELYEGTLLSDKSQAAKEQLDMVFPDVDQLRKELIELEALEMEKIKEMMRQDDEEDLEVNKIMKNKKKFQLIYILGGNQSKRSNRTER